MKTGSCASLAAITAALAVVHHPAFAAAPGDGVPGVGVTVDAAVGRHAINPLIYGVNFGTARDLKLLQAPLNRMGGNNTSTYNWQANALNLDNDYYYESYPQDGTAAGAAPDAFVAVDRHAAAATMLTVPMIGWVAKLGPDRAILPSYSVAKYGAQCSTDPYFPDAGDGLEPDCTTPITGNDPNDAYIRDTAGREQGWLRHLTRKWGAASAGGVRYYLLDNEPSIWFGTHPDIRPIGVHAAAFRDLSIATAKAIHATDPSAFVAGPEEWGWEGYLYSGYDQQYAAAHDYSSFPDHDSQTGGLDYLPYLLKSWQAAGHPVDVVSVHFYPQGDESSDDNSEAVELLRNRSTRQLWDKHYVAESYIDAPVYLIPRLKTWVAQYYDATTPIAVTEYNWGGEGSMNGATTQADIYGIFGREGLDMATRFTVPAETSPVFKAMQLYRNYDGHGTGFGETSVSAHVAQPDEVSAFAAIRAADGALTVVVIDKELEGSRALQLTLRNFTGSNRAQVWRLESNSLKRVANAVITKGKIADTLPASSVTLYVVKPAG